MYTDVIIAGFGGQGVLLIGNLLAYAAMEQGLEVTFMPVYGVEMRGGTANCTVVVSDREIGSPIVLSPVSLISMNQPSLEKYQPCLQDGGIQIVNSSLANSGAVDSQRVRSLLLPANEIASELGSVKMANMVALGAWVRATGAMPLDAVQNCMDKVVSPRNHHLIPRNQEAVQAGADFAARREARPVSAAEGSARRPDSGRPR
jgi:2-oxoglutarate ferredoxin oxidoreductase subunit gamma